MRKTGWLAILIFTLIGVSILWLGGGFMMWGGRTGLGMHGMMTSWRPGTGMGSWFFGPMAVFGIFGMFFPLGFLFLLVLGAVWLFNQVQSSKTGERPNQPPQIHRTCPSCGRMTEADWRLCPTCGYALADNHTSQIVKSGEQPVA